MNKIFVVFIHSPTGYWEVRARSACGRGQVLPNWEHTGRKSLMSMSPPAASRARISCCEREVAILPCVLDTVCGIIIIGVAQGLFCECLGLVSTGLLEKQPEGTRICTGKSAPAKCFTGMPRILFREYCLCSGIMMINKAGFAMWGQKPEQEARKCIKDTKHLSLLLLWD